MMNPEMASSYEEKA